ncbi:hypothetical protein GCM10009554_13760 [Kribbella koreensis]|uniref:Glyoxalase/fosfomycin resistance/dioxygenase domain-containing protein n=1 Tax=Kribbella koreensis TaxID=57909 RepID=A0ABN1PNZ3_9ACTN
MITNISLITVYVHDIDEAKAFYTEKLDFAPGEDITVGEFRWCTVYQADHPELHVVLMLPGPPMDPESAESIRRIMAKGSMHGFGINTDDCVISAPPHRPGLAQNLRRTRRQGRRVHPGTIRPPVRRRGGPPRQLRQLAGPGRAEAVQRRRFPARRLTPG